MRGDVYLADVNPTRGAEQAGGPTRGVGAARHTGSLYSHCGRGALYHEPTPDASSWNCLDPGRGGWSCSGFGGSMLPNRRIGPTAFAAQAGHTFPNLSPGTGPGSQVHAGLGLIQ